jgi:Cof subfamily protein (haloacid dehalogenase superfamily)
MVKLIVTDMDNTLVYPDKSLPQEIFPLIRRLYDRGIRFAAASARHYNNLSRIFAEVSDIMGFICDNGAYGEMDGQVFVHEVIPKEELGELVEFCEGIPNVYFTLSARSAAYYRVPPPWLGNCPPEDSENALFRMRKIEGVDEIPEEVYRIALYDPQNPLYHSLPMLQKQFGSRMNIVATDDESVDIMKPGINKGTGLAAMQSWMGITPAETMAFGDYYNDIEMLDRAYYSYAVENALDEVKEHCNFRTKSNQEQGVILAVEEYLRQEQLR